MGEKKLREYLTYNELKADVVDWSFDTFVRRIKKEDFPAIKDAGGGWLIPRAKMELWFKKREVRR